MMWNPTAGTVPLEKSEAGFPPSGAEPDRKLINAPPPVVSTACACPAGCAEAEAVSAAPRPGVKTSKEARRYVVEMPQFGQSVVTKSGSSRGGG